MKTLERLRQQKAKAVDRMAELNGLSATEKRDLTPVEKMEYDARKSEAENLSVSITELEVELAAKPATTALLGIAGDPPKTDNTEELKAAREDERKRGTTIRERLTASKLPVAVADALSKELIDGGVTLEKSTERIFEEMAKQSAAQPDQRTGLAVQRGDTLVQVETLARDISTRDNLTKEAAVVRVLNSNPKLYDLYLQANPAQCGPRQ
jgi:hypothetical protein